MSTTAKNRKQRNPINHVLSEHYNVSKIGLIKFRKHCSTQVQMLTTSTNNRGASDCVTALLEERYPGFANYFPLERWHQKKRNYDGTYDDIYVSKSYESSLTIYVKAITTAINSHGKKAHKKMNSKLETQLNLDPFYEEDEVPEVPHVKSPLPTVDSETINLVRELAALKVKTYKSGDVEIQF